MSISPAQFTPSSGSTDHPPERDPSPRVPAPVPSPIAEAAPAAEAQAPAEVFNPRVSTDMRIDAQHRVYYQVVNDHSGEVICEIPCEQIRELEESNLSPAAREAAAQRIDVKS
jgi:hypothetical protein